MRLKPLKISYPPIMNKNMPKNLLKSSGFKLIATKEPADAPNTPQRISGRAVFISKLPFFFMDKKGYDCSGNKK